MIRHDFRFYFIIVKLIPPYNPKLNPLTLKSAFLRSYHLTSVKIFYLL